MAGEDEKGPEGAPGPPAEKEPPEKGLDRRDVLRGLSTVPALGLFGYAWSKKQGYEQAQKAAASANAPKAPANLSEINVALIGAGAQGQVLIDAMLRIPGLRFRAVCDIWKEYNQKRVVNTLRKYKFEVNGYEDYREMLDKEKDIDAVVDRDPRLLARPAHRGLPEGGQARLLREGDVEHPGGRAEHGAGRPGDREAAPDRAPAAQPPALPALPREAAPGGAAARADRDRQRPVEPRGVAGPRLARALRDPGGPPEAVRLQVHGAVPQLALVQGHGRRSHRRPGVAPDRHLQLVPGRQPLPRHGQRRQRLPRPRRPTSGTTP